MALESSNLSPVIICVLKLCRASAVGQFCTSYSGGKLVIASGARQRGGTRSYDNRNVVFLGLNNEMNKLVSLNNENLNMQVKE